MLLSPKDHLVMYNYGLLGKTLGHSFSKAFFENYFSENNIAAVYSNFELTDIVEIESVFEQNISGLNVTIPYKELVIPFLDELSEEARRIGAVNVIQFKNGKRIGHNTDAFGFHQSIKPFLTNMHERAILLGTGGASKAVEFVFKSIGLDVIHISRNPSGNKQFSYSEVNEHMVKACKVIVNCTPLGTFPKIDECVDFPFQFLTKDHLVVDLIYNPKKTKFLEQAQHYDATILNGESMLMEQALKSWEIWNS